MPKSHDRGAPLEDLRPLVAGHPDFGRYKVYRYVPKQFLADLTDRGILKIGSLAAYRQFESKTLGDQSEGRNALVVDSAMGDDFHPESIIRHFVQMGPTNGIENLEFVLEYDFPAFCFSYDNSLSVMTSLVEKPEETAVIEISDVRSLADQIAAELSRITKHPIKYVLAPVLYKETKRGPADPGPSILVRSFEKAPAFSANREGRIIFLINSSGALYLKNFSGILRLPRIRGLLREVDMPS